MRYVNNWVTQLTGEFGPGDAALPVSGSALDQLPPGLYALSLTTSTGPAEQTAWEIIHVTVTAGVASVTARGREGTIEQEWSAGALVYCAVTAGTLNQLSADAVSLGQQLAALALRVAALEGDTAPGGDGLLADTAGNILTDDQNQPLQAGTV